MSDTPRTDAARHDEHDPYMAIAAECSKLERELNAANQRIKRLEEEVSDLEGINAAMMMDAAMYEDRGEHIKQLEHEIELFREHADYEDVCLVEAILKGEKIGRKEKQNQQ